MGSLIDSFDKGPLGAGLFQEGGMFGPAKGLDTAAQDAFIRQLTEQSNTLFSQAQPLRQDFFGLFSDVMSGNFNPMDNAATAGPFSSMKGNIEGQYGLAKDAILANTARGGAQTGALADLEMSRAEQASSLPSMIAQQLVNQAYGSIFPTSGDSSASSAMSGFNSVAGQKMQQQLMQQQQQSSNMQGIGSLLAMVAG